MDRKIFDQKFERWQHGLLDVGKRNKMISYKKLRRSSLELVSPSYGELYRRIALKDEAVSFEKELDSSPFPAAQKTMYLFSQAGCPVTMTVGEIKCTAPLDESPDILKNLRAKARLSLEEQGIHVLYLCFGFLEWRQKPQDDYILSPLILVPVNLTLSSFSAPYVMKKTDGDIVVNPTLAHVLASDYHIVLPELGAGEEPEEYFRRLEALVGTSGWRVRREVNLGLLSFLKIVMYRDLLSHREQIAQHPVIRAFCQDPSGLPEVNAALRSFPHDSEKASGHFQVLDADASQQDAILLSRQGVSFVLQGPPGTGKSQTIANIIAEAMGAGKKVLFVSEKMAALAVVYRRLEESGLSASCLALHNDKADKKAVVADLVNTLEQRDSVFFPEEGGEIFSEYEGLKGGLNRYFDELKTVREPLGLSAYEAISQVAALDSAPLLEVPAGTAAVGRAEYLHRQDAVGRYAAAHKAAGPEEEQPWRGTLIRVPDYETTRKAERLTSLLSAESVKLQAAAEMVMLEYPEAKLDRTGSLFDLLSAADILSRIEPESTEPAQETPAQKAVREFCADFGYPEFPSEAAAKQRIKGFLALAGLPLTLEGNRFRQCDAAKLRQRLKEFDSFAGQLEENRQEILAEWSEKIFSVDYENMYARFRSGRYFLRGVFDMQYRSDKRTLEQLYKKGAAALGDYDCLSVLEKLDRCGQLERKSAALCRSLFEEIGLTVPGVYDRKDAFSLCSRSLEELYAYLSAYQMTERELEILGLPPEERKKAPAGQGKLGDYLKGRSRSGLSGPVHDRECTERIPGNACGTEFIYGSVFDEDEAERRRIEEREAVRRRAQRQRQEAARLLESLGIIPAVREKGGLPDEESLNALVGFVSELEISGETREAWREFCALFAPGEIDGLSPEQFSERVEACRDTDRLEEWISLLSLREECSRLGLDGFLGEAQEKNVPEESWQDCYTKAFLLRWLYEVTDRDSLEMLRYFKSAEHNGRVDRFADLDGKRLACTRQKLYSALKDRLPDGTLSSAYRQQEMILRRESEKKRRLMPLRQLFAQIPGLLQELKPCFMMSPLSVAYFLDSESFAFDLVIFDEASQILPEDAIGAIFRGKQAVIAGDTRQMPPTSFFSAVSSNDEDLYDRDEDEEADETEVGESILDEAAAALPSCTLLWHYRSRDESLIAFSNRQIYGNRLITFPGCLKEADRGLEYILVPDGVYEGGGRNRNLREAKRCAELVEEHIQKHPERSLGIVAFSEKQQGAIEDAVMKLRVAHPEYESFFDEQAEAPFFIKNLENVQGDERDTIIFSICYARNDRGKMYMNFGPLGKAGGERRLNVAVTRAKYNVKLVGSIQPQDIDLNRTKAEGTRLLREYILYAIANGSGEAQDGGPGRPSGRDDAFAGAVADFLAAQGYSCRRNVGESACRVDIAVKGKNGYLAGIACDGDNYTTARTARDRDVARRNMLGEMGWRQIHLWSAAWLRHPKREKEELLAFLKQAEEDESRKLAEMAAEELSAESGQAVPETGGDAPEGPALPEGPAEGSSAEEGRQPDGEKVRAEDLPPFRPEDFAAYTVTDEAALLASVPGENIWDGMERRISLILETEQPIHLDLLLARLAPAYHYDKVSPMLRRMCEKCLSERFADDVTRRDGFLYLKVSGDTAARAGGERIREAYEIPDEEVDDVLRRCEALAGSMPEVKECARLTAGLFGFDEAEAAWRERLKSRIEVLA